jgi:purine-binding chemotaxis protein CheW
VVLTIDAIDTLIAPAAAQCQAGMLQRPGAAPAQILDIFALLAAAFRVAPLVEPLPDAPVPAPAHGQNSQPVLLLRFDAAQPYALPLDEVSEIAPVPAEIIAVAQAEAVVIGIAAWRERVLTVFSLRALLGWPPAAMRGGERMIILRVAGRNLGLVVDGVRDIIAVPPERLEPVPGLLAARLRGQSRLQSIFRGEGGQLLAVLSAATLLGEETMQQLGKAEQHDARPARPQGPASRYVVFSLGEEEFGLDVGVVDEVAAAPEALTKLPRMPKFLRGVVNLRGEALPVIDQRARFGLPPFAGPARAQRLIVVRGAKNRAGLLVDAVSEVLSVADAAIEPAPKIPGEASGLIRGVLNLPQARRMILLLDGAALLSSSESALLAAFAARAGASAA